MATRIESIIDCDVHQRLGGAKDLFPYLSRAHREDIAQFGLRIPSGGYPHGGAASDPTARKADRGDWHAAWEDATTRRQ